MQFAIAICSLTILRYYFTTVQYTIYFAPHHSLTACLLKVWYALPKYMMMLQIPYRLHEWPTSLSHGMSTLNCTQIPSCSSLVSLHPAAVLLTKLINMTCKLCGSHSCVFWNRFSRQRSTAYENLVWAGLWAMTMGGAGQNVGQSWCHHGTGSSCGGSSLAEEMYALQQDCGNKQALDYSWTCKKIANCFYFKKTHSM
jgi:hypothetical protein